jgi:hypothetical protein
VGYLGKRNMRALARNAARRLPIVGGLLDRREAALAERDRALAPNAAVVSNGPERAAARSEQNLLRAEHNKAATPEDIFYCFRLLLGRTPNPEEWPGHSSRVGEDLENVVSSYVTSREFSERGLLNKTYRDQVELVRLPRFSLFASNDDLAVGRHVVGGAYESKIA